MTVIECEVLGFKCAMNDAGVWSCPHPLVLESLRIWAPGQNIWSAQPPSARIAPVVEKLKAMGGVTNIVVKEFPAGPDLPPGAVH